VPLKRKAQSFEKLAVYICISHVGFVVSKAKNIFKSFQNHCGFHNHDKSLEICFGGLSTKLCCLEFWISFGQVLVWRFLFRCWMLNKNLKESRTEILLKFGFVWTYKQKMFIPVYSHNSQIMLQNCDSNHMEYYATIFRPCENEFMLILILRRCAIRCSARG
jgi:hypothetical protein